MKFIETSIPGAYVIELERIEDERGFFARTWCTGEFAQNGLDPHLVQCNTSFNAQRGTVRGMHYQASPHEEAKLVRCTMGSIVDVIIDLRPTSPTFKQSCSTELTSANRRMLYAPKGTAHGFQTLEDNTEVFYQMTESYYPKLARGVRWDDPTFQIRWPLETKIVSVRDRSFPNFTS